MNTKQRVLLTYAILLVLYAAGTLLLPPAPGTLQRYHITLTQMRLLDLTVIVLYGGIWLCALYGFYTLHAYYALIRKNKDGKALAKLTVGVGLIAFWLPITSNFSLYTNYLTEKHPSYTPAIGILQNYLTLLIPLVGFIFLSIGARRLSDLTKQRISQRDTNILILTVIVIGVTYTHLIVSTSNQMTTQLHMSPIALLLTIAVPYIYMWGIGLLAVYEIHHYQMKAPGILYRKSWRMLAFGLGSIISVTILLQYLVTISARLTKLSLNKLLLLVYVLLILLAVAYVLIAVGVRALKRIEEV